MTSTNPLITVLQALRYLDKRVKKKKIKNIEGDITTWCDIQMDRWGSQNGEEKSDFSKGVFSGYSWMKTHIPHLFSGDKCDCPKN